MTHSIKYLGTEYSRKRGNERIKEALFTRYEAVPYTKLFTLHFDSEFSISGLLNMEEIDADKP